MTLSTYSQSLSINEIKYGGQQAEDCYKTLNLYSGSAIIVFKIRPAFCFQSTHELFYKSFSFLSSDSEESQWDTGIFRMFSKTAFRGWAPFPVPKIPQGSQGLSTLPGTSPLFGAPVRATHESSLMLIIAAHDCHLAPVWGSRIIVTTFLQFVVAASGMEPPATALWWQCTRAANMLDTRAVTIDNLRSCLDFLGLLEGRRY